ncbi:MAG: short chain dehydrogenase [Candidatus Thermoplasmatota archaeon]|jgi:NADH-quinone oxidoreductase subunit J|nr:short chain dehydrogenase [Candidatus Thermoplasmatota archaeon]MCL5954963.1 short chain dehydrogenase [Candidatus Thermoplasmatota archaeon]
MLAAVASVLFLVVFGMEAVSIQGSFTPVTQNLTSISVVLFNTYVVPFELLSLILVAGIIGMFYIAGRED